MRIIDAKCCAITPDLIREAIKDLPERAIARVPPAQECMWESIGIVVSQILIDVAAPQPDLLSWRKELGGHRMVTDTWMMPDRIRFELDGEPIVGIVNLALPVDYAKEKA